MFAPLLASKLSPPALPPDVLSRRHLAERLAHSYARVLLVIAPAGFGKTTLLAEWLSERMKDEGGRMKPDSEIDRSPSSFILHPSSFAWLSLDEHDNDPTRFWGYLIAALDQTAPGVGDHARAMLQSPQPPPIEVVLGALIDELGQLSDEHLLVLDDYHCIQLPEIHGGLSFLIDHLPASLRLAIASRAEPPLPLARLRLNGLLLELRPADLRFSAGEIGKFLARQGLQLTADEVASLASRTEGWPAALQLAALSLRATSEPRGLVADFAGSNRHLVDYFGEEVLRRQPEDLQRFLLHTSILDQLCGELCDALMRVDATEPQPAARSPRPAALVLEDLERAGLFLLPLDRDRRWYRYHSLFREFLADRLSRESPRLLPELHRRAAEWYARAGLPAEAVAHLLASGDTVRAAAMIEEQGRSLLLRSEVATVLGWLRALPADLVYARPGLCLIEAWAFAVSGQFEAAERPLRVAEQALAVYNPAELDQPAAATVPFTPRNLRSEILAVHATLAGLRRDAPRTIALARAALAELPADSTLVRGVVSLVLGTATYISGDMTGAAAALDQAARTGQAGGLAMIAIFALRQLGELQARLGQLRRAEGTYHQAIDLGATLYPQRDPERDRPVPVAGTAYVGLGLICYERNELDTAEALLTNGIYLGRQGANIEILLMGPIGLARVQRARGQSEAARATIADTLRYARATGVPRLADWISAEQARLALSLGDLAAAIVWDQERQISTTGPVSYLEEIDYMALAQLRLAQGRSSDALQVLERLRDLATHEGRNGSLIEILTIEALAHMVAGDILAAYADLRLALRLAAPEGYIRTFVDLGVPMFALLQRLSADSGAPNAYIAQVLAAFPVDQATPGVATSPPVDSEQPLLEPLTAREIEVLGLVAAGLSNHAIAAQLVVGLSTVKKHINNIYGKLAVASRTQALKRARELGLLH